MMTMPVYRYRKSAEMINRDALAWLSVHKNRPFFLFLNYFDAHDPYIVPEGFGHRFGDGSVAKPRSTLEAARDGYDDCLAYLDDQIDCLLRELQDRGVLENTLVVVTADHGEGFGEHGLAGHGVSLYRPELHVPLLMALPHRVPEGVTISVPVSLRDLAPTIASLVAKESDEFPGTPLDRFWTAKDLNESPAHPPVLSEVDRAEHVPAEMSHAPARLGRMQSLIADGWSYIRNGDMREEIYNLKSDPAEKFDLINSPTAQDDLEHLRELLDHLTDAAPVEDAN